MGISVDDSRDIYSGDGASTEFTANFKVYETSDIDVYLVDSDGVETEQTLGTHYTVTLGSGESATVTFVTAPGATESVALVKSIPKTQPTSFPQGPLDNEDLEDAFDRLTSLVQQVELLARRFPKLKASTSFLDKTVEEPVEDKVLAWDASGNLVNKTNGLTALLTDDDIDAAADIVLTKLAAITANRGVVTDGSGKMTASAATDTEVGYLSGVTSAIQTQLDAKAADADLTSHTGNTSNPHSVTASQLGLDGLNTAVTTAITDLMVATTISGYTFAPGSWVHVEYFITRNSGATLGSGYLDLHYDGAAWQLVEGPYGAVSGKTSSHGLTFAMSGNDLQVSSASSLGSGNLITKYHSA